MASSSGRWTPASSGMPNCPTSRRRSRTRSSAPDRLTIPITGTVINTGDRLILIDAGTGGALAPTATHWMSNFRASGYAPEEVDAIIVSHCRGDHIQGIRAQDGKPAFRNASLDVSEAD